MAFFAPALDGGSSVFVSSLSKNLTLVAVGPRIGRRYGDIITSVVATDRHPRWLVWRRGVHRGRIASGPASAGMRWPDGASAYRSCRPQLVIVSDADEAPDGGPPFVKLLLGGRKIEEQLRALGLPLAWVAAKAGWTAMRLDF